MSDLSLIDGDYMSDSVRSNVPLGFGNMASWMGLATVRDDHGNSTRGTVLQCADGSRHKLSYRQWNDLHAELSLPAMAGFFGLQFDGDMPLLFGQESPLERGCQALAARPNSRTPSR